MTFSHSDASEPLAVARMGVSDVTSALPGSSSGANASDNHHYPVQFSGTGSEYFRIWIVNLLLIVLTCGIYLPWAKVRKLKYFYGNTRIDSAPLDFHGEPLKMLRGTLIAGVFFIVYSYAAEFSALAAVVSALAFLLVWPPLYRASLRFRMANTSWRGFRLNFQDKSILECYSAILLPNALVIVGLVAYTLSSPKAGSATFTGPLVSIFLWAVGSIFILALPYFLWRIYRYQIGYSAWGPMRMEFRAPAASVYKVYLQTLASILAILAVFAAAAAVLVPSVFQFTQSGLKALLTVLPLVILFFVTINILPRAYLSAKLHNLVWSRTGNSHARFKSVLSPWKYVLLQLKNYLLILLTLGFYWPFAVIATKRMQLEAVTLKSRIDLNTMTDMARKRSTDAAGDMAADLFDFDLGM